MYKMLKLSLAINALITFYLSLKDKLKDKKLTFIEIIQLIPALRDLAAVIPELDAIKEEWKTSTPEQRSYIATIISNRLNLSVAQVTRIIEIMFSILPGLIEFDNICTSSSIPNPPAE